MIKKQALNLIYTDYQIKFISIIKEYNYDSKAKGKRIYMHYITSDRL